MNCRVKVQVCRGEGTTQEQANERSRAVFDVGDGLLKLEQVEATYYPAPCTVETTIGSERVTSGRGGARFKQKWECVCVYNLFPGLQIWKLAEKELPEFTESTETTCILREVQGAAGLSPELESQSGQGV